MKTYRLRNTVLSCLFALQLAGLPLSAQQALPGQQGVTPAATPQLPAPTAILAMVRSTIVAVDQGNKTGNYTVLRDLASPSFHDANNPSKLSLIFGPLVSKGVDLLAATVVEPDYPVPPAITPEKMLYVIGSFPIVPQPVNFEILYQMHEGRWRVHAILVEPRQQ